MKISQLGGLIAAVSMFTSASFASPVMDQSGNDSRQDLNFALEQANKNKGDSQIAGQYLHDAFNIAFQMGEYSLAKKLLAASVSEGVEMAIWDNVALAEIFAREGDYTKAKGRLVYVIDSFKAGRCRYNPVWKKFLSALEKGSQEKIDAILDSGNSPALFHPNPTESATHKKSDVNFTSLDKSLPKEMSVDLVIDARGNVQCVSVAAENKQYKKMLSSLKKRHFNPAKVNDKPVWQYGKTYVIHLEKGHEMILQQMRNERRNYLNNDNEATLRKFEKRQ